MEWSVYLPIAQDVLLTLALAILPWATKQIIESFKDAKQREAFDAAVNAAYLVVHQISRKTDNKIDDKVAEALKIMKDVLGRNLSKKEVKAATLKIKAKHEAVKFPSLLEKVGGLVGVKPE